MATFGQMIYMCLDEIKGMSDDFSFNEEHILFLICKYRALLLDKKYGDIKKPVIESDYQDLYITLSPVTETVGETTVTTYMKSTVKLPKLLQKGITKVYSFANKRDYFDIRPMTFVTRERLGFTGVNRFLTKVIYCAIGPDGYLYVKSSNSVFSTITNVKITAIFEDCDYASQYVYNTSATPPETVPDLMDRTFPLEEELIPPVLELVVKDLLSASYRPADNENDAKDAASDLATYIARNAKSNLSKQLDNGI